jgi:hypothetical protein
MPKERAQVGAIPPLCGVPAGTKAAVGARLLVETSVIVDLPKGRTGPAVEERTHAGKPLAVRQIVDPHLSTQRSVPSLDARTEVVTAPRPASISAESAVATVAGM